MSQRLAVNKIVTRKIGGIGDTKRVNVPTSIATVAGNGYIFNPLAAITQGTGVANRVGNVIHLDKISMNFLFDTIATSNPVRYALFIFESDLEISTSSTFISISNGTLAATTPILGTVSSGTITLDQIDPSQARLLYHTQFVVTPQVASQVGGKSLMKTIYFKNKKMQYRQDSSPLQYNKNLYVLVLADQTGATVGSTSVGNLACNYMCHFKE